MRRLDGVGQALLGGVGAGVFGSIEEGVAAMVHPCGQLDPDPVRHRLYGELYEAYVRAYQGLDQSGTFAALAALQRR